MAFVAALADDLRNCSARLRPITPPGGEKLGNCVKLFFQSEKYRVPERTLLDAAPVTFRAVGRNFSSEKLGLQFAGMNNG